MQSSVRSPSRPVVRLNKTRKVWTKLTCITGQVTLCRSRHPQRTGKPMPRAPLSQSLLALAIASIGLQAQALERSVDDGPIAYEGQTISESLTITGTLETDEDAVELADGTHLQGDLKLNAQIAVTGATSLENGNAFNYATAVDLSGDGWGQAVQIDGSVTNQGSLSASGLQAQGLTIEYADIEGGLVNDGTITISDGVKHSSATGTPAAISIQNANIDGQVRNNGEISVSGVSGSTLDDPLLSGAVAGIQILDSDLAEAAIINGSDGVISVTGSDNDSIGIDIYNSSILSLSNAGRIDVASTTEESNDWEESTGIFLENAQLSGDLTNSASGVITATGNGASEATGIEVEDSSLASLVNHGSILVSSSNDEAVGIQLDDSVLSGDLNNSGNITANGGGETIAIELYQSAVEGRLFNSGEISATSTAEESIALYFDHAELDGALVNQGSLVASGNQATAIKLDSAEIEGGIHNSGTIKGDATGIHVLGQYGHGKYGLDASTQWLQITQSAGLIEGGQYAILVEDDNLASLELSGGTIRGDIAGIFALNVSGQATFDGDRIGTRLNGNAGQGWLDLYSSDDSPSGSAGHLILARPHVTLDGELEMNSGSTLELNLSNATEQDRAILTVNGLAYFAEGSNLLLTPQGQDFRAEGSQYILVAADSIEDNGLNVASSSSLLDVDLFKVEGNQVLASVTSKSAVDAGQIVASGGAGNNALAAFAPFYSALVQGGKLADSDPLLQALSNASSDPVALGKLAEQLAPQTDGAASQAAGTAQGLVSGATSARTGSLRGQSSGSPFSQAGVWVQGLSSNADQGRRDGIAGYDADSQGIAIGLDGKLNDNLTLGIAYSNLRTDVKSDGGNKTEVDSQALTLYSGLERGNLFVDASLTYGINDNSGKRHIAGTLAKGDYDSRLLGLNLTAGYSLHFANLTLEPRVAGRYSRVDIDAFSEKGSSAALRQQSQRYEVIEAGAGVRLAGLFQAGQGSLEPELRLMAYHDFAADQSRSTSSYVLGGTPFVTSGAKPARDSYEAGLGLTYRLGAVSLGAGYDYIGKSGFDADVFQARLRYDF
ncbi:autotransporter domain-containing protein [Stutzerimonas kirkiae]|uniref:Autotransporter domain-containing protein n=2 Tax=Stutzerimonas kirkiae TaxID=2211392 RepID=A0A4Q9RCN9_9GAMM|nr:autotransporter domain-containing protein [Stutzerimonas kirkiae]TBV01580.1 autotransporter domain-containing protein [Stutzerimonas kirkiae]